MQVIKIMCFFCFSFLWSSPNSIGEVIASENMTWAIGEDGEKRDLQKGSYIFLLDEMHVGDDSRLQIRFTDGSILNLIADTVYAIQGYRYRKMFEKDEYSASLVKGGFRSLTGAIAKKNPDGYEIKTPTATIGVRGTIIDAVWTGKGLYVSCTKGIAVVMNGAGQFRIGPAEARQFLLVEESSKQAQYFIQRPSEMNVRVFAPPTGGVQIDAARVATPKAPAVAPQHSIPQETIGPLSPGATEATPKPGSSSAEEFQQLQKQSGGAGVYIQGGC